MFTSVKSPALLLTVMVIMMLLAGSALADVAEAPQPIAVSGVAEAGSLWEPTVRMVLSLSAVLALVGGCTWIAKRMRNGAAFKSGMIEVISGVSLGGREKVVLLRVGDDDILVGLSPTGMRRLHVLTKQTRQPGFADYMEQ